MNLNLSISNSAQLLLMLKQRLLGIGVIFATIIFILIVFTGQNKKAESLRLEKETELKKIDAINQIIQLGDKIKSYDNIIGRNNADSVKTIVTKAAKESSVKLVSFKAGREESKPLYAKFSFTVVISANNYHAIGKFISRIENQQPGIYFVDEINIKANGMPDLSGQESTGANELSGKLNANLTLSIVVFKE